MKIFLTILLGVFITIKQIFAQADKFVDSLKSRNVGNILLFKTNCVGCVVLKSECDSYIDDGDPWDQYVIWQISSACYIKKFTKCGHSKAIKLIFGKDNPFKLIKSNLMSLDTTIIQYPLSYSKTTNRWFEMDIDHFESYSFSFPTFSIGDKTIRDYAFREISEMDESLASVDDELRMNIPRYKSNNSSTIKQLLDILLNHLKALDKKLLIL